MESLERDDPDVVKKRGSPRCFGHALCSKRWQLFSNRHGIPRVASLQGIVAAHHATAVYEQSSGHQAPHMRGLTFLVSGVLFVPTASTTGGLTGPALIDPSEQAGTAKGSRSGSLCYASPVHEHQSLALSRTVLVRQIATQRQRATRLLDAAKRAVEIAIEDSEAVALAYLAAANPSETAA